MTYRVHNFMNTDLRVHRACTLRVSFGSCSINISSDSGVVHAFPRDNDWVRCTLTCPAPKILLISETRLTVLRITSVH